MLWTNTIVCFVWALIPTVTRNSRLHGKHCDIHFGEMMETEAVGSGFHSPFSNQLAKFSTTLSPDSVRDLFKELERRSGRIPEDKAQGVVKLDIDLLVFDNKILKPEDMEREYIRRGMSVLF